MAASRPLVFDRKAVAPGARSLRKGDFLEQDHVVSTVGSVQVPGWLITMPDWVVQNNRMGDRKLQDWALVRGLSTHGGQRLGGRHRIVATPDLGDRVPSDRRAQTGR